FTHPEVALTGSCKGILLAIGHPPSGISLGNSLAQPFTQVFRRAFLGFIHGLSSKFLGPRLGMLIQVTQLLFNDLGYFRTGSFFSHLATTFLLSLDRKSTRLNSSHVSISYAVFCLKKKR